MITVDLTELQIVEESVVRSGASVMGGLLCGLGCDGLVCGLWCGK